MRYVNKQDTKDQVERFGMIVRDEEFYKNAEATLEQFLIEEEVSDEEKVEDSTDEVTEE
tara:strand:- start:858 stop:1034 length:177 start_codon:yes stop_codon:yes gene_type:complete